MVTCLATPVDGSTHVDTYMYSCVDICVSTCVSTPKPQLPQVRPHVWTDPQVWAHLWGLEVALGIPKKKNYPRATLVKKFILVWESETVYPSLNTYLVNKCV